MALWSAHVTWTQADPESPAIADVVTRLRGHTPSVTFDDSTRSHTMAASFTLQAATEAMAARHAQYLVAEATHFQASEITVRTVPGS